jgi:hypothetical protein
MLRRFVCRPACAAAVAFALATASCGAPDLAAVTGRVLVEGKPAARAVVMFHPDWASDINAFPATATTAVDGTFSLASGDRSGARPGKYVVTVVWPDPNKVLTDAQKMMGVSPYDAPDLLRGRYATRDKSALRAEVKPGVNALDPFDLK